MTLDKTKPFAETIGNPDVKYHQDGKDFDSQGVEVKTKEIQPEEKRKPGRPKGS